MCNVTRVDPVTPVPRKGIEFYDELDYSKHKCKRECLRGRKPMTCFYKFRIEWYQTMSKACYECPYNATDCSRPHCIAADGVKRSVMVINRMMPGPAFRTFHSVRSVRKAPSGTPSNPGQPGNPLLALPYRNATVLSEH